MLLVRLFFQIRVRAQFPSLVDLGLALATARPNHGHAYAHTPPCVCTWRHRLQGQCRATVAAALPVLGPTRGACATATSTRTHTHAPAPTRARLHPMLALAQALGRVAGSHGWQLRGGARAGPVARWAGLPTNARRRASPTTPRRAQPASRGTAGRHCAPTLMHAIQSA